MYRFTSTPKGAPIKKEEVRDVEDKL